MGWQRECHGCRDRGIDCGPHHTTTPSPSSNASIKVVLLLPIREAELPRLCCLVLHLHWYSSPTGVPPPSPYVVMPQFQPSTSSSHSTACPSSRRGTAKPLGTLASLQLLVLSWLPLTTPSLRPPPPPWSLLGSVSCSPDYSLRSKGPSFPPPSPPCAPSREVSSPPRYSIRLSFPFLRLGRGELGGKGLANPDTIVVFLSVAHFSP